jgi:hypothetical protein
MPCKPECILTAAEVVRVANAIEPARYTAEFAASVGAIRALDGRKASIGDHDVLEGTSAIEKDRDRGA